MMLVAQRQRVSWIIMPASVALAAAIIAIVAFTLWQAREDARAQREAENIVQAIKADVSRNIELYDLSLQGLQKGLATAAVAQVADEVQRLALFDYAASASTWARCSSSTQPATSSSTHDRQRRPRSNTPLALLMIDLDNFKTFNDQHGHCRADEMLREFGRLLRNCSMRAGDVAARYGGAEFAVMLPNTNTKSALVVAERIQSSMLERSQKFSELTVSMGVASRRPRADRDPSALIRDADAALYRAKANGRNRCEMFMVAVPADI